MTNTEKNLEIDIVIPTTSKDLAILPLCLEGIHACLGHITKDIFVVAPNDNDIKHVVENQNAIFVDETTLMGFSPNDMINVREDKRGWLYQQLIKLHGGLGSCENYLVIDSDVVLLKEYNFINKNGTPNFITHSTTHESYLLTNYRLTGIMGKRNIGFVADKMLFNKSIIQEIHNLIEDRFKCQWFSAIIDNYDNTANYGFSEFELYALIYGNRPYGIITPKEKVLSRRNILSYKELQTKYPTVDCLMFHHYISLFLY